MQNRMMDINFFIKIVAFKQGIFVDNYYYIGGIIEKSEFKMTVELIH